MTAPTRQRWSAFDPIAARKLQDQPITEESVAHLEQGARPDRVGFRHERGRRHPGATSVAGAPLFTSFGGHSGHGLAVCAGVWSWRVFTSLPGPTAVNTRCRATGGWSFHCSVLKVHPEGATFMARTHRRRRPRVRNRRTGDPTERLVGYPPQPESGTTRRETASRGTCLLYTS